PPVAHSASSRDVLRTSVPQVIEVTGSESPSTFGWTARNNRVRQELSRARIRAIENSLENGQGWVPPSSAHRKTWEEEIYFFLLQSSRTANLDGASSSSYATGTHREGFE
ncbi:protein phosphatase 2C and cyclic nucleotide-binding/kinase domain-containing protein, partial [Trifolium medium]|nr:protein phosphatase 2C and cyclic nucleotide-binding/kinase domain-containing protein [Trifolium medium]